LRVRGTTDAIVALVSSERDTDLETGIERIATPTLIVSGDRDLVVPNWHCRDLTRRLPNARLVTLCGGGHVPHIQFADAVNQLVSDFLEK
jgi:pimeloyl-ACP methyl ester carboxylesterase